MRGKILCGASVACLLLQANAAKATLVASDSFPTGTDPTVSYQPGVSIYPSQGPTNSLGFSGTWSGGSVTSNYVAQANTLSNAAIGGTPAGDVQWLGASNAAPTQDRNVARSVTSAVTNVDPSATPTGSVFYTATLVEEDNADTTATAATGDFVGLGYVNTTDPVLGTTSAYQQGFYVGFADESASDPGSLVIRTRITSGKADEDQVLVSGITAASNGTSLAGQTYLVVTKTQVNSGTGNTDLITAWVNPTSVASDAAMGTPTASFYTYAFQGGDLQRLEFASPNNEAFDPAVEFDETRLATTSADLYVTPTPEPASLGLIVIAAGSLLRRRRR